MTIDMGVNSLTYPLRSLHKKIKVKLNVCHFYELVNLLNLNPIEDIGGCFIETFPVLQKPHKAGSNIERRFCVEYELLNPGGGSAYKKTLCS